MGGRKRHLGSFIWWTMINGLAFSRSLLPQCSLWASSDKRVFERDWTPQILLFVPDLAKPRPHCSDFNQVKPAKRGSAFKSKSQSLCVRSVCVCMDVFRELHLREERQKRQEGGEEEEKSVHCISLARLPITPLKTFRALPWG